MLSTSLVLFGALTAMAQQPTNVKENPDDSTAQVVSPTIPRMIERRAQDILKQMSDFLAATPRFAFEAEETFDELRDNQPRVQLTNARKVVVERPSRFVSDATGDTLNRSVWFDGQTVSSLDKSHNTFATLKAPGSIDVVLDMLMDRFDIDVPLADFLYADPYSILMEKVTFGRYLGVHQAAGSPCHHLVFSQETIEWQIWIAADNEPLPRKFVITYVREPGEPQYSATITKWNLKPEISDNLFQFQAPQDAERIDAAAFLNKEVE